MIIWFTGLSGSGKSTLAQETEQYLLIKGEKVIILDGDVMRRGLCADLGFSAKDRRENIRRVSEVGSLLVASGIIVLIAVIAPYEYDRQMARILFNPHKPMEIYCKCPLDVCEQRDTKGLYERARCGQITDCTGIDMPYEVPESPDLILDTDNLSISECLEKIITTTGI